MKPGQKIGAYELVMPIAEGGMGTIWKARHPHLDRWVAIKQIRAEVADDEHVRQAFIREVKNLSRLHSPQIVQVLDFGFTEVGQPYMVTEFLDGEDLRHRLVRETRLPLIDVLVIGIEVLKALSEAHAVGLVHRDLKPGNVFLQRLAGDGEEAVKVLDFGVAKLLSADGIEPMLAPSMGVKGSPRYMAPEQVLMDPITPAADIYSFGATMYRMLTGEDVFVGSPLEILRKHIDCEPIPLRQRAPDVEADGGIEDLVMVCLRKKPEDRPLSAAALKTRLELMLSKLKMSRSRGRLGAAQKKPNGTLDGDADSSLPSWFESTGSVSMAPAPITSPPLELDIGFRQPQLEPTVDDSQSSAPLIPSNSSVDDIKIGYDENLPEFPTLDTSIRSIGKQDFDPSRTIEDSHPIELLKNLQPRLREQTSTHPPSELDNPIDESAMEFDVPSTAVPAPSPSAQRIQSASQTQDQRPAKAGMTGMSGMTGMAGMAGIEKMKAAGPVVLGGGALLILALVSFFLWSGSKTPVTVATGATETDMGLPIAKRAVDESPIVTPPSETPNVVRQLTVGSKSTVPETVAVTVDQGPARFVRIRDRKVLCRATAMCQVPVDDSIRVYKKGFKPLKLQAMDLYDRRNHRWRVILRR
jgi:serine/threonine protein kinase